MIFQLPKFYKIILRTQLSKPSVKLVISLKLTGKCVFAIREWDLLSCTLLYCTFYTLNCVDDWTATFPINVEA